MATDAKELERVGRIHYWLDYLAKTGVADSGADINDGEKHHSYTAAEVRAWPETKAKLQQAFAQYMWAAYSAVDDEGYIVKGSKAESCVKLNPKNASRGLCMYREQLSDALSPGRALTEDGSVRVNEGQAEALGSTNKRKPCTLPGGSHSLDHRSECCSYCGMSAEDVLQQESHADALGTRRRTFKQKMEASAARHDAQRAASSVKVSRYQGSDLDQERDFEERTFSMPANEAARLRNIAALAAELSKPVTPRFPAEGRSERALSVTNGMIRGRG